MPSEAEVFEKVKTCLVEACPQLQLRQLRLEERQARVVGVAQADEPQRLGRVIGSLIQES